MSKKLTPPPLRDQMVTPSGVPSQAWGNWFSSLNKILEIIYPVGTIIALAVATNPATLFGIGTWTRIEGAMLVGYKAGDPDFGTLGATGGQKTVNLAHVHSMQAHVHSMKAHVHEINHVHGAGPTVDMNGGGLTAIIKDAALVDDSGASSEADTDVPSVADTDSKLSATQSVLNPYKVKNIWERTA